MAGDESDGPGTEPGGVRRADLWASHPDQNRSGDRLGGGGAARLAIRALRPPALFEGISSFIYFLIFSLSGSTTASFRTVARHFSFMISISKIDPGSSKSGDT